MAVGLSFQLDRDVARPFSRVVTLTQVSGSVATLTTSVAHLFQVGHLVEISEIGEPFDGTFTITSTPTATTFTYSLTVSDQPSTAALGLARSPAPAYLKMGGGDSVLQDIITQVSSFAAEPWDYNTARVVWGLDDAIHAKALDDLSNGLRPRVALTRSAFGAPVTPLDGEKILDEDYNLVVAYPGNLSSLAHWEPNPAVDPVWDRPITEYQGLFDHNLVPGRWYYYTIFYYLRGDDPAPQWRTGPSVAVLLPLPHQHAEKFWELIPPYYRARDAEFTAGTGRDGVLWRLVKTLGFEADYSRTLAEGIEHSYDIDTLSSRQLIALGETTMGIPREASLGDIRYRSLLSSLNALYNERGSSAGIQKLSLSATKYNTKVVEGVNMMALPDDAEFLTGTGSWGTLTGVYDTFLAAQWPGVTLNPVSYSLVADSGGPSGAKLRQGAMTVAAASGSPSDGLILACGLGNGAVFNRLHTLETTAFTPRFQGIRCTSGQVYTFSFYSRLLSGTAGNIHPGIMWFNSPVNYGPFDITTDFISLTESTDLSSTDSTSLTMTRHQVQSSAPLSLRGEPYVYAVPFIRFATSSPRNVTAAMFNEGLNPTDIKPITTDIYLTLGTSDKIGDPLIVLGGGS